MAVNCIQWMQWNDCFCIYQQSTVTRLEVRMAAMQRIAPLTECINNTCVNNYREIYSDQPQILKESMYIASVHTMIVLSVKLSIYNSQTSCGYWIEFYSNHCLTSKATQVLEAIFLSSYEKYLSNLSGDHLWFAMFFFYANNS